MEETPDLNGAYPRLDREQMGLVAAYGEQRPTRRGDVLYSEGDRDYAFFLVLAGTVEMLDKGEVISLHGPGRFLGELGLLTGQPTFLTARVAEPGKVIVVPPRRLRELARPGTLVRRSRPARVPHPPFAAHRAGRRAADHRLAVLCPLPATARLRRAQPTAASMDRRRGR
ncbi:cyclic nucleotide-binding domain-containing protein [Actinomadura luteofluorescens]|uniref:cyclic nucleotide-binding domain-containing protein n=1 Tax=Actinomadura luteofluorescens TaxID=46163 RepID=UPI0036453ABD